MPILTMRTSRTTRALVALVVGLPAGIAIEATRSAPLLRVVSGIEPLGTLWVNGVRMTIVPLIVAPGIASAP